MVQHGSSHSALVRPPTRPRHALKDASMVDLELAECSPVLDSEPKQICPPSPRVWISWLHHLLSHASPV